MQTHTMNKPVGMYFNNPIKAIHHLKDAGFTQEQAEAQIEIMSDLLENNIATKKDLEALGQATKKDIELLRQEVKRDMKELELKLEIRLSIIVTFIVGFFYSLDKLF